MPENTYNYGTGDNYPVYYVSWYATLVYCNKRSISEGLIPCYTISGSTDPTTWGNIPTNQNSTWNAAVCNFNSNGYRLPTEAEREYAAQYNDERSYPWGETSPSSSLCNFNMNVGATLAVGSYPLGNNKLGLCDLSGNVREWVWDWLGSYTIDPVTDPTGPVIVDGNRVQRGGSFPYEGGVGCADRTGASPYMGYYDYGFRIARTK